MKKIIFLIFIILIVGTFFMNKNYEKVFNNYDIIYKEDETTITFISNNSVNALLINDNKNENELIILNYKSIKKLKKGLKKLEISNVKNIYNITPVIINMFNTTSKTLIPDKNDLIKLKYNNKDFCIYMNNNNIKKHIDCNFIYIYKFNSENIPIFGNNVNIVFQNYNNRLPISTEETLYENWIDIYTLTPYEYVTLKLLKDSFDIIIIPIVK